MKKNPDTPYCTIREAVTRSGLSEKHIRELHHEGKVPGRYHGNTYKVDYPLFLERLRAEDAANAGMI